MFALYRFDASRRVKNQTPSKSLKAESISLVVTRRFENGVTEPKYTGHGTLYSLPHKGAPSDYRQRAIGGITLEDLPAFPEPLNGDVPGRPATFSPLYRFHIAPITKPSHFLWESHNTDLKKVYADTLHR
jgi:hypothetical protein